MRGGGGALTRSGLDDGYYWDDERCQFTVEPLLPLAPKRRLRRTPMTRECSAGHWHIEWRGNGPCWICRGPGTLALWVLTP